MINGYGREELLHRVRILSDRLKGLGYRDFQIGDLLAEVGLHNQPQRLRDTELKLAVEVLEGQLEFALQCLKATGRNESASGQ